MFTLSLSFNKFDSDILETNKLLGFKFKSRKNLDPVVALWSRLLGPFPFVIGLELELEGPPTPSTSALKCLLKMCCFMGTDSTRHSSLFLTLFEVLSDILSNFFFSKIQLHKL
jgi:hypothetical protein